MSGAGREMTRDEKVEVIARACHEANRAWCESHSDHSQVPWPEAPDNIRASAIDGVNFHLAFDAGPRESHENWCGFKLVDGWTYGPVKDPEAKTHPCLVAYDELPVVHRVKDELFSTIVATLAPALRLA